MIRKISLFLAASAAAFAVPVAPVVAKPKSSTPAPSPAPAPVASDCSYTPGVVVSNQSYVSCSGFYAGNWIKGSGQLTEPLGLVTFGVPDTGNWLVKVEADKKPLIGGLIDFGQTLYGETIVGVHFGNIWNPSGFVLGGQGNNENVTVFLKYDFGTTGASGIQLLNTRGYSNAALYATGIAVPEPGAWALLILGFGAVGGALRSARKRRIALTFA